MLASQGAWPPSGRTMVHWWSQKERGGVVSVWNVAHNVGGGLIGPLFGLDYHVAVILVGILMCLYVLFGRPAAA